MDPYQHQTWFALYGPYWRQLRKIATLEILTSHRVEQLQHVCVLEIQTSIKELFGVWSNTKNESGYVLVELKQWFTRLLFNMVLQMAIGKRYSSVVEGEEEEHRCRKATHDMMHLLGVFTIGDAFPFLRWFDFGRHVTAMKETAKELDKIVVAHSKEAPIASGAWPILGHLPLLRATQTPHRTLGALADKYGPLFTIKLGAKRSLVLNNWEMARECFTKNDIVVSTRPNLIAIEQMTYNGAMFAFAPYGPYWRQLRKIATLEILTSRRVEQLQHVRVLEVRTSIKELFSAWSNTNHESGYVLVELKQWFTRLLFNMVLQMAIGKRYSSVTSVVEGKKEEHRCIKATNDMMHLLGVFTIGDAFPYLRWFDFGGHVKAMKETAKELDKILGEWLGEHRRNRITLGEKIGHDQDFMDVMLSLLDGTTIDGFDADTIIKATTLTLILGGSDTSSVTLIWAICLLLRNPLIMKKAIEELDTQVGKERCVSEFDISKLGYLQAIVKESLRLHPPIPLAVPREFSETCTLSGYDVKKRTRLILNLWKIQTDPSVWSDPLEFKPERFLTTHKDVDVRGHHFELLPFGCGRRICPGISFGLQMVHLALATFLHSFEILNPSTEPIDMTETFGISNTKATPLEILVKPRLSPNCYEVM